MKLIFILFPINEESAVFIITYLSTLLTVKILGFKGVSEEDTISYYKGPQILVDSDDVNGLN